MGISIFYWKNGNFENLRVYDLQGSFKSQTMQERMIISEKMGLRKGLFRARIRFHRCRKPTNAKLE